MASKLDEKIKADNEVIRSIHEGIASIPHGAPKREVVLAVARELRKRGFKVAVNPKHRKRGRGR